MRPEDIDGLTAGHLRVAYWTPTEAELRRFLSVDRGKDENRGRMKPLIAGAR